MPDSPSPHHMLALGKATGVTAEPGMVEDNAALRLALTANRRGGTLGRDFGDEPTFLLLPDTITNGVIEIDLRARPLPDAPDYARDFIGLAYRIQGDGAAFESVYLRHLNGRPHVPPPPRDRRAVQYFAYPDFKYDQLRDTNPDQFEWGADFALDQWHYLRLELSDSSLAVGVDGRPVLDLARTLVGPAAGGVGLWVDIGTEGWFKGLRVTTS